ncbi:hypothetical protein BGC_43870 [Burkholderia sp. 3C]
MWAEEFSVSPTITENESEALAKVYIGNEAREFKVTDEWPFVADLGAWWYRQTGLPFVFARWMVRRSIDKEIKTAALDWLAQSNVFARTDAGRQQMACRAVQQRLFSDIGTAGKYFDKLVGSFSDAEILGEALFLKSIKSDGQP